MIALLLVFCFVFVGCDTFIPGSGSTSDPTTETNPEETTPWNTTANEDSAYLKIPVEACPGLTRKYYGLEGSIAALSLKFYDTWETQADGEGGYFILRDGKQIGHLISGIPGDVAEWSMINQKTSSRSGGLMVNEYLEKSGTGETLRFRHRFYYRYNEDGSPHIITLTMNYGELDEYGQLALRAEVEYKEIHTDPMYNRLSNLRDKPILVLGNSFIGSSEIGYIYNAMERRSGKEENMQAIARGYATVTTYSNDTTLMNRIANGEWSAVFMCGFYGDAINDLGVIKRACEKSGTQLIIFPAHNENRTMIESAKRAYPTLICLDWKREIDELIAEGRSKWYFCIDDEHFHSTTLAGYVGAMMIWRAIYGEMPDVTLYNIPQEEYDAILGDYLESPSIGLIDPSRITVLK